MEKVVVVGASPKPDRYSNKAIKMLIQHGHQVIPVNPGHEIVEGLNTISSLAELKPGSIDTVTMYVGSVHSSNMGEDLKNLEPRRVIFNPGSENPELENDLRQAGIGVVHACTLVMLSINQFE